MNNNINLDTIRSSKTFKNFLQRMLLLVTGSAISLTAFHGHWFNFLFARFFFSLFIVLMGIEMHYLLPKNIRPRNVLISIFATMIFAIPRALQPYISFDLTMMPFLGISAIFILYGFFTLFGSWNNIINELQGAMFILVYPGLLVSYWLLIIDNPFTTLQLYTITATAYSNDGFAYLAGFSIGRIEKCYQKKPMLSVSPGKTYTGYLSGMFFGMLVYWIIYHIEPRMFGESLSKALLFGFIINIVVILGDLLESALKRNLNKKDSGILMLGRGGMLDTFDSMILASPVYFLLYTLLFLHN